MKQTLTERQQHILWATIRHYISTAEPVGSKVLVEEYNLSVSPATIRNSMSFLEKVGLLYQPHASAGRIPSDSGYRIYVDQLIKPDEMMAARAEDLLKEQNNLSAGHLEVILRGASQILATMSGYITLVTWPQTSSAVLRHLQLVPIDASQIMLILVTNSYETQSAVIKLPATNTEQRENQLTQEDLEGELQILSNFLNSQLRGRSLADLKALDWSELDREFKSYTDLIREILGEIGRRSERPEYTKILISGLAEALHLPEFSQLQQVQTILHLLEEEQELLWPLIFQKAENLSDQRVKIRIGAENPLEPMRACSLVSATYSRGNTPVGSVGILGPTRMMYESAIALVEATADYLSTTISEG